MTRRLDVDPSVLEDYCRRWRIDRMELFGSVLRADFDESRSDVDVLVSFADDAEWTLLDHVRMERELADLLDRPVDVVNRRVIEASDNWIRRQAILEHTELLYAAG